MTALGLNPAQLEAWASYLLGNWALQATLLLGAGLLVTALPRTSAGLRHTLALCALIAAALSPLTLSVPHPVAARVEAPQVVRPERRHHSESALLTFSRSGAIDAPPAMIGGGTWLLFGWALGGASRLLWLLIGSLQVAAWLRRSQRLECRALIERYGYEMAGLDIRTTPDLTRPAVAGVLHPAILLPNSLLFQNDALLRPVLLHERAHYRRRDPLRLFLAEAAGALLFWHPLSWWLRRQLERLAEDACDREVLAKGIAPGDYARTLLELLAPPAGRRFALACSLGRAGRELQRRIEALFLSPIQPSNVTNFGAVALALPMLAGTFCFELGHRPASPVLMAPQPPVLRAVRREATARPSSIEIKWTSRKPKLVFGRALPPSTAVPGPMGVPRTTPTESMLAGARSVEPASGRVVVYLLDISSSMRPYQEAARRDLLNRVAALHGGDSFNVVAFATEQHRFAPTPVEAGGSTRESVAAWLATLPEASGTCPLPALEAALSMPDAGSVILFSDEQTSTGALGEQVQNLVRQRGAGRVSVLAVTLGEPAASGVAGIPSPMAVIERFVTAEESAAPL